MKKIVGLALVLALGFQFLMKLGILTYFQLNKAYIIEVFCENKAKPQLHCDGQCFLAKKLQEAEDREPETEGTRPAKQQIEIPSFLVAVPNQVSFQSEEPSIELPLIVSHYSYIWLTSLFHPPKYIG